jgi:hypothetical protein
VASETRTDTYRYFVDSHSSEITPLASVEAFLGPLLLRVINISMGGMAFVVDEAPSFQLGDVLALSVSIRERAFPIQAEIKAMRGQRASCAFLETPPAFHPALREFLGPKFLGDSIALCKPLLDLPAALELVPGSSTYEAYVGQNQTGVFVWMGEARALLQLVAVTRDLVLGWDQQNGIRTGKLQPEAQGTGSLQMDVQWDRVQDITVLNYLADVLLAWLKDYRGRDFVEKLLSPESSDTDGAAIKFPIVS